MELGTEPGSGFEADETIPCLPEGKNKGRWKRGREASEKEGKGSKTRGRVWRTSCDRLEGGPMAELSLEVARANARCQGSPASVSRDSVWSFWKRLPAPAPKVKPEVLARLSGSGTFAVHFREQLAQWPLDLPGTADEGRHHLEQLVLVLLPDHRDGLQDELHLLQLMSPWGGKHQTVEHAAHVAGACGSSRAF